MKISRPDTIKLIERARADERERCAAHLEQMAREYNEQVKLPDTDAAQGMRCGAQSIRNFLK